MWLSTDYFFLEVVVYIDVETLENVDFGPRSQSPRCIYLWNALRFRPEVPVAAWDVDKWARGAQTFITELVHECVGDLWVWIFWCSFQRHSLLTLDVMEYICFLFIGYGVVIMCGVAHESYIRVHVLTCKFDCYRWWWHVGIIVITEWIVAKLTTICHIVAM